MKMLRECIKSVKKKNREEVLDYEALSNLFREEGNQPKMNAVAEKEKLNSVKSSMQSSNNPIPAAKMSLLLGLGTLASTMFINKFDPIHNSLVQSDNSMVNYTSSLPFTCSADQQAMQSKIDEATKILYDANKRYGDQCFTTAEDSTNHKDVSQSVMSRIFSVLSNPWDSLVGSAKKNDNSPEPKWFKDLHKSEDLEEIIDGGTLPNLFYEDSNNDYQFAKPNITHAESSKTVGSNQTAITKYSAAENAFMSTWGSFLRNLNPFGSREHHVTSAKGSNYQIAKPNVTHAESGKTIESNKIISESGSFNTVSSFAKVDNGINTSKQQGTFVDSVELSKLTTQRPIQPGLLRVL
ncbi:hypothetical protein BBB02_00465 [Wolbachia endosymbiont of Bemisia tabaci]|uniref:hypothetical protein n=2 Tax=Wolbachia endosymbiont of Bemisia tabaci TaxID=215173 RepID=UPI000FD161A6|nr:hypothetical protein [Wolbachia endosymbiont of Bemisia tabaci]AZU37120.1 hypothetical protein BBB02_00465 [Wolbachia endosymbiont of Bemisia tabaci]